jgi:predicted transcriptional regulator
MEQVRDLMQTSAVKLTADTSLAVCGRRMTELPIRHLAVMDKGRLVGTITDVDVFGSGAMLPEGLWFEFEHEGPHTAAGLSRPAITVDAEDFLPGALRKLVGHDVLVVMEAGEVVGLLSEHDVVTLAPTMARESTTVGSMCHRPVTMVPPSMTCQAALQQMKAMHTRHLIVGVAPRRDRGLGVSGWPRRGLHDRVPQDRRGRHILARGRLRDGGA